MFCKYEPRAKKLASLEICPSWAKISNGSKLHVISAIG